MDYLEARGKIRTGDAIFFAGDALHSRLIRRWTMSRLSHTGVAIWDSGSLMISDSMEPGGVKTRPLSHLGPFYWLPVVLTDAQRQGIIEAAKLGDERLTYSARGIFLQIIRPILNRLGLEDRIDGWLDKDSVICSQWARHLYAEVAGLSGSPVHPSPEVLARWLEAEHAADGTHYVHNVEPRPYRL